MSRFAPIFVALLSCATLARATVPADCWALRKHGADEKARDCFEALTRNSNAYNRAEGFWGLEEWERANSQFRLTTQSPDAIALYKVRWGMLLHERFNDGDAADLFHEALAKDPANAKAYMGLAIISADSFDGQAAANAAKAIAIDPKLAEAHELLADLALTNDDRDAAAAEADKAIALENDALDAMAIHAAIELMADHSPDPWLDKIRAVNSHYGEAYARVAHQLELHYRYEDAVTWYRKAIYADPQLWSAHSALGIDLMRLGKEDEPHQELEVAYSNGYRDAATVNSLRLLDSYKNFDTFRDGTTILKLNKSGICRASALHAARVAHHYCDLREKVPHDASRPRAGRGLSQPRRFCRAHHGNARTGCSRRDFRRSGRDGQPLRAQARGLQLGLDSLARDESRLHSHRDQSSRAALVYRRTGGA